MRGITPETARQCTHWTRLIHPLSSLPLPLPVASQTRSPPGTQRMDSTQVSINGCSSRFPSSSNYPRKWHLGLYHIRGHLPRIYPTQILSRSASSYVGFLCHGFILCGFYLTPLYPVWVSSPVALSYMGLLSHTALSYVGFLSQAFILCEFHLTLLYPTGVSSRTTLSYNSFISHCFIL